MRRWRGVTTWLLVTSVAACEPRSSEIDPAGAVEELLAADRALGSAARDLPLDAAIARALAPTALAAPPGGTWQADSAVLLRLQRANPTTQGASATWAPIRGGVSADGTHGFTFGFMTQRNADGSEVPLKYLAYWVRDSTGWHVVAYRRRVRAAGPVDTAMLAPYLPVAPSGAADRDEAARSLAQAEQAFSDEAQRIGLGRSFERQGRPDAINMGGPDKVGFVHGAAAIGASIAGEDTSHASPVSWNADGVVVAPAGDMGVTFGRIRSNTPGDTSAPIPFFTIWVRERVGAPWRYIAE